MIKISRFLPLFVTILIIILYNQFVHISIFIDFIFNSLFLLFSYITIKLIIDSKLVLHNKVELSKNNIQLKNLYKDTNEHYIVFIEINNLNTISQFYNLYLPDIILKKTYERITERIKQDNVFIYSENQIVIIQEFKETDNSNTKRYEEQLRQAEDILSFLINNPILKEPTNEKIRISLVVGVASNSMRNEIKSMDELVRLAHFTTIQANKRGMNILVADEVIKATKKDMDDFALSMEEAIKLDEFIPYFQPIIDSNSNHIIGFESLVRWQKDKYRIIEAGKFKDIAMEKQLFIEIDKVIVFKTLEIFNKLRKQNLIKNNTFIVCNLSIDTLKNIEVNNFINEISKYNILPDLIEFDIQNISIIDSEIANKIESLKKAGFHISLDNISLYNFNINNLLHMDIDSIKFNVNIINIIHESNKEFSLISMLLNFTRNYKIKSFAKNIENKQQLEQIKKYDIDYLQGYYFTRPLSYNDFVVYLTKYSEGLIT